MARAEHGPCEEPVLNSTDRGVMVVLSQATDVNGGLCSVLTAIDGFVGAEPEAGHFAGVAIGLWIVRHWHTPIGRRAQRAKPC
jgi:hypothetical protein